jgi:hyperosmotically inducible periplasmic protein
MNSSYSRWTLLASVILSFGVVVPALAQSDIRAASTSMRSAGQSIRNTSSETGTATNENYDTAKIALRDTEITAEVKAAFHRDSTTRPYDIDVTTLGGVVTLEGKIPSHDVAVRAKQLALETEGVRKVRDRMVIIAAGS